MGRREALEARLHDVEARLVAAKAVVAELRKEQRSLKRKLARLDAPPAGPAVPPAADSSEHESDCALSDEGESGSDASGEGSSDEGSRSGADSSDAGEEEEEEEEDEEDDDPEPPEPPAPPIQELTPVEREALRTEPIPDGYGLDYATLDAVVEQVVEQLCPVEGELRFDSKAYVITLLRSVLRGRARRPEQGGFIAPDETEQLVCGGATQARASVLPLPLGHCCPSAHAAAAGWQDHVCRRRHRGRLRCTHPVRGTPNTHCLRVPTHAGPGMTSPGCARRSSRRPFATAASLCNKVLDKLRVIEEAAATRGGPVWQLRKTCSELPSAHGKAATDLVRAALGGSGTAELRDRGALFLSDTCTQVERVTRDIETLRGAKFVDRATKPHGHFLLFVDEADAMQRTDGDIHEPIKLERRITTLRGGTLNADGVWVKLGDGPDGGAQLEDETFCGPHACVAISATLLPVFLRGRRDAQKCREAAAARGLEWQPAAMHPFYTTEKMNDYMGVDNDKWLPFHIDDALGVKAAAEEAAAAAAAADAAVAAAAGADAAPAAAADGAGEMGNGQLFLKKGALTSRNMALDDDGLVMALYQHAYKRPLSLLLDVTITRVTKGNTVRAPAGTASLHPCLPDA